MENKSSLMKDVFYNTYGTFFYFFCQWFITVLVVRISGYHDAGVLSLIISTTNLFYCIALFGVRQYQVSDVIKKYTDNQYLYARIITITLCLIIFMFALCFLGFDQETLLCSLVYIIYKSGEALSDVLFGSYQRYSCYKNIAISFTLKGILTVSTFALVLMLTKNLFVTLLVNVLVFYAVLLFYDIPKLKQKFELKLKKFDCRDLLKLCFPLMLYSCMVPYLNFITRLIIEKNYGTEILGYYSSVTMVFVVMSTLMGSIFVSVIPKIASFYIERKVNVLKKSILGLIVLIFAVAIIACFAAALLGDFLFSLVFGKGIVDYMYLLIPTIIASITLTYTGLFSSVLISFGKNNTVLYCNLVAVILCTLSVNYLVDIFDLTGTLYSLIFSLFISAILLFLCIWKEIKKVNTGIS